MKASIDGLARRIRAGSHVNSEYFPIGRAAPDQLQGGRRGVEGCSVAVVFLEKAVTSEGRGVSRLPVVKSLSIRTLYYRFFFFFFF